MLKIIGTFILIYLIFHVFIYYMLPVIIRWYLKRVQKKYYQNNPHRQAEEGSSKKQKVKIKYDSSHRKYSSNEKIGEYIDFEEIKEKPSK